MSYALEYSIDGQHWRTVPEKRTYSDCPGTGIRNVPVTRERLQDIQREAEFWSHRYPHIRIKHPEVRASDMRDGDIYFWKYADDVGRGYSDLYHCKSRKAVVINGRLVDTFWSDSNDGARLDPDSIVLEFKGNKADLRTIREWEVKYYDEQDVVDMRHSNSSRAEIYVKASALRSRDAMLEHIANMKREQESVINSATYKLELLDKSEADVKAGRLDEVIV